MPGPTEEGSIVAHVKADLSQFDAAMDRADARVRKTSTQKAEVKVTADVDQAVAKVETVDRAVQKLGDDEVKASVKTVAAKAAVDQATRRQELAVDALKLAYQRLDDAQIRGGRTETQMMALHLAAARAENTHEQATLRLAAANEVLRASQVGDTTRATQAPASTSTSTGNGMQGYTVAIVAAVATLIPMLAPLAGYVAGVGGAFTMMGAAGVFAILGIKSAMQDGTSVGNTYAAGLQILKKNLDTLSGTAADRMMLSFRVAVSQINQAMPALNQDVSLFAGILGNTGNILLSGILSGLRQIMPLFLQAGVYVEQLAAGFQKWTQTGGLASFVQMAVSALPQVDHALGSLLGGAMKLISGLAPLGSSLLSVVDVAGHLLSVVAGLAPAFTLLGYVINTVANVANFVLSALSLLGPVLPGIATGAAAVGIAFLAWNYAIQPLLVKLGLLTVATVASATATDGLAVAETDAAVATTAWGAAIDFATGPVGIILGLLGVLGGTIFAATRNTTDATAAMENYTAAVQQDNGVIGQNTTAQAASTLQKNGAADAARRLGLATKTLTEAALGDAQAQGLVQDKVNQAAQAYKNAVGVQSAASQAAYGAGDAATQAAQQQFQAAVKVKQSTQDQNQAIKDAIQAYNDLQNAVGGTTIATSAELAAQQALAAKYGMTLDVYAQAQASQQKAQQQTELTTASMKAQGDAAGLLKNQLDALNGANISAAQAQNAFDQALTQIVPVTTKTTGGVNASQVASAQGSVSSAVSSATTATQALAQAQEKYNQAVSKSPNSAQGIALQALALAQTKYNQALDADKTKNTTATHNAAAAAALALSRAQATVTSTQNAASAASLALSRAQNANSSSQNALTNSANSLVAAQSKVATTVTTGTSTLEGMSAAAIKNRGTIINLVSAAQTAVETFRGQTDAQGNLTHSADETAQKMVDMKATIIDTAAAAGLNAAEVSALVDQIFRLPKDVQKVNIEVDTEAAKAAIAALSNSVDALGIRITSNLGSYGQGLGVLKKSGKRDGGTIGFSNGGSVFGPGTASHDDAGLYALANGEEVISNRFGQADYFRAALKAMNAGMGPDAVAAALPGNRGGMMQAMRANVGDFRPMIAPALSRSSVTNNNNTTKTIDNSQNVTQSFHISAPDPFTAASETIRRLNLSRA